MKKIIYEYECKICGDVQEKWHERCENNTECCEKCGASADNLKKVLSPQKVKHSSWSTWNK